MHLRTAQRRSPHGQAQKSSESIGGKSRRPGMPADVLHRASICFSWTPIRGLIGSMLHKDSLSSKLVTRGAAHAWRWMDSFRFGDAFYCVRLAHFTLGSILGPALFFSPRGAISRRLAVSMSNTLPGERVILASHLENWDASRCCENRLSRQDGNCGCTQLNSFCAISLA